MGKGTLEQVDGQASGLWKLLETSLELLTVPSSAGNALFMTDYPGGDAAEWSSNPSPQNLGCLHHGLQTEASPPWAPARSCGKSSAACFRVHFVRRKQTIYRGNLARSQRPISYALAPPAGYIWIAMVLSTLTF